MFGLRLQFGFDVQQFNHTFTEYLGVKIDIFSGGGGCNQGHVVEWSLVNLLVSSDLRHQNTAIQSIQMHIAVQFGIGGFIGLTTILGTVFAEPVFGTVA